MSPLGTSCDKNSHFEVKYDSDKNHVFSSPAVRIQLKTLMRNSISDAVDLVSGKLEGPTFYLFGHEVFARWSLENLSTKNWFKTKLRLELLFCPP